MGTLTMTNSAVSGNTSSHSGGGIWNAGILTITNSTVSANTSGSGGGIFNNPNSRGEPAIVIITNSIISGNTSFDTGGISNYGALTMTNSTVSGNTGVGIQNEGLSSDYVTKTTLIFCTIINNCSSDNGEFDILNFSCPSSPLPQVYIE